ncbi:MAG: SusC/RagA family TonB-linked outer membrane protein, partial [Bacteroides sp.]
MKKLSTKQEILKAGDRLVALAMVFALSFITLPMWASTNKIDAKNELTQADLKKTITGIVYDSQGEPLIGANVLEQGTQNGTITDIDGRFSLSVTEGGKLTVSYIGFDAQVINITSSNTYKITLKEDVGLLDEVVVVGYGIQKRSDLTGAISSVKSSELPSSATTSVEHMLAGKVAGMQVRAVDAQPGGGISILIRGAASVGASNEPLYVIDGFPVGGVEDPGTGNDRYSSTDARRSPLNSINPNDIESIEVLKDASATSIYGARAANGVVLITTKKGKLGKVEVAYDTKFGVQSMKNDWKVMNATELMHTRNRFAKENWMDKNGIGVYGGNDPSDANSPFRPTYTEEEILAMGKGTNWMKEVSRTGITQEHNVSVSGASERSNHLISINYFDQEGILRNNNFNRITARANLSQNIASWLRVGINATGSRIKYDNPTLGGGSGSYKGTNENSGMMEAARIFSPLLPVKDSDGNYTTMEESKFLPNPMSLMEIYSKTKQNRIFAQSYVEF